MRTQPPSRKAIPLLLLCIGYLSILPFSAVYIMYNTSRIYAETLPFSVYELLPLIGLALMVGYRQAVSGRKPWGAPKTFWTASTLFNVGVFYSLLSTTTTESWQNLFPSLITSIREAFHPAFDSLKALSAVGNFVTFAILAMPVVAILSAIETYRAFRKTKPESTATPEPA